MSKLKEMRQKANLTQVELAEKTDISIRTLQSYEQGAKVFDHARIDTIIKVCLALHCKMTDVIENEEYISLLKKYEK